jgi:uncharacterized membrane protein
VSALILAGWIVTWVASLISAFFFGRVSGLNTAMKIRGMSLEELERRAFSRGVRKIN